MINEDLSKITKDSLNANYLIKCNLKDSVYFENLKTGFIFKKSAEEVIDLVNRHDDKFTIYKLNNTDFLELFDKITNPNVSYDFKVIANSTPHINGEILDFKDFSKISKDGKCGLLKIKIEDIEGDMNLHEFETYSFYIDLFINGRVNQVVNKFNFTTSPFDKDKVDRIIDDKIHIPKPKYAREFRDSGTSLIHISHSTSNELLLFGPYSDLKRFSEEFEKRFRKWTAQNDSIIITGSLYEL